MPQRMLQWHYRSRHQSLIAVSNHEFYDDRLFVVPSPHNGGGKLGLRFHHVANGVFDRGRAANNQTEAAAVADAVMEHAKNAAVMPIDVGWSDLGSWRALWEIGEQDAAVLGLGEVVRLDLRLVEGFG